MAASLMAALLGPKPVSNAGNAAREGLDFNARVTLQREQVENSVENETSRTRLVGESGLENIACRVYPIESRDRVASFAAGREYTDKILMDGFHPRANSSQTALVTRAGGEQSSFDVLDIERQGSDRYTTLLCRARFDRA